MKIKNKPLKQHTHDFVLVYNDGIVLYRCQKSRCSKTKKHTHRWSLMVADCDLCGGGEYYQCHKDDCGELKSDVASKH